jgi:3-oxoacyl-[acyl-carrier protein] reductase
MSLAGRTALVTGASRPDSIGAAVARRLRDDGARVVVHGWRDGPADVELDLGDPEAPAGLVERVGPELDIVVAAHADPAPGTLATSGAEDLDRAWAVNARASVLLAQALARMRDPERPGGRVVLFTSGQEREGMPDELPYAISKGAIHGLTRTLAAALAPHGITCNAVNPGPVDTGWPDDATRERLRPAFPAGRWGRPEDIAPVVAFLCSDDAAWVTGNVVDAEGGFRRGL